MLALADALAEPPRQLARAELELARELVEP